MSAAGAGYAPKPGERRRAEDLPLRNAELERRNAELDAELKRGAERDGQK